MQLSDNPCFDTLNKTAMAHKNLHLSDLVTDPHRAKDLVFVHDGMELDVTRQLLRQEALAGLVKLAHAAASKNGVTGCGLANLSTPLRTGQSRIMRCGNRCARQQQSGTS